MSRGAWKLVRRGLARDVPTDARVDSVMSSPVVTIDADAPLHDAVDTFSRHAERRLAVVDDDRFVGMISLDEFLQRGSDSLLVHGVFHIEVEPAFFAGDISTGDTVLENRAQ